MARSTKQIAGDETVHHISQRAKRGRPKPKMSPPLTPMIDVTFLLLLYFLLTMNFRQAEGQIPGSLPKQGTAGISIQNELKLPVYIELRPTGVINEGVVYEMIGIQGLMRDPQELYDRLMARKKRVASDEIPVVIKVRAGVRWQYVVEAFNQAVRAKFKNIGFAS